MPDLVIGANLDDPNSLFYRALRVAVDATGRIYVLDAGNHRVQVFDRDGAFARTLGGEGQGPGELGSPADIAITGDRVMVWDRNKRRLVTWDHSGNITAEIAMKSASSVDRVESTSSALFLRHVRIDRDAQIQSGAGRSTYAEYVVQRFGLEGQPEDVYLRVPSSWPPTDETPTGAFAVDSFGAVYVSTLDEYQVLGFSPSGDPKWALRADWPRRSTKARIERLRSVLRREHPERSAADIEQSLRDRGIPELENALATIRVDGHGHIYVVIVMSPDEQEALRLTPGRVPFAVDVYSSSGDLLFAGLLDGKLWDAASGNYVYARDTDPQTMEATFVRSVLHEPFQ